MYALYVCLFAFFVSQVRTTAPEKYRVKPSNSSCEPGTSLDIVVSLHGGKQNFYLSRKSMKRTQMSTSS